MARLYVVATPIGNLGDWSSRAAEVLRTADLIAAEDTRVTGKLCQVFDIHTPLTSCHQHNDPFIIHKKIFNLLFRRKILDPCPQGGFRFADENARKGNKA